jgi:hypothetical protein
MTDVFSQSRLRSTAVLSAEEQTLGTSKSLVEASHSETELVETTQTKESLAQDTPEALTLPPDEHSYYVDRWYTALALLTSGRQWPFLPEY